MVIHGHNPVRELENGQYNQSQVFHNIGTNRSILPFEPISSENSA
jgi:hypothetical protein